MSLKILFSKVLVDFRVMNHFILDDAHRVIGVCYEKSVKITDNAKVL
jgi:hypothetical protein